MATFRQWAALLPPTIQLFGVQLPGREERWGERPHSTIASLVQEVAGQILTYAELPFVFFGHSFGALVAYEVASCLEQAASASPACLFVSAGQPPHSTRRGALLHQLDDGGFVRELERLGGFPPEVLGHGELLSVILPALRADVALYETYHHTPRPRLFAPVLAAGGYGDPRVSRADLLEWQATTMQFLGVRMFSGGHFYLQQARHALVQMIVHTAAALVRPPHAFAGGSAGGV